MTWPAWRLGRPAGHPELPAPGFRPKKTPTTITTAMSCNCARAKDFASDAAIGLELSRRVPSKWIGQRNNKREFIAFFSRLLIFCSCKINGAT